MIELELGTMNWLLVKLHKTGSLNQQKENRRPKTVCIDENVVAVEDLNSHRLTDQLAKVHRQAAFPSNQLCALFTTISTSDVSRSTEAPCR